MNIDVMPVWALFLATVVGLMVIIEIGYRLGSIIHLRSEGEKEAPVSAIAGATLGLLAFMLALTFSIAAERFDARKALVREEANAIGTAYLRTDFLPEPDRSEAKRLLREYLDSRLSAVLKGGAIELTRMVGQASSSQTQLWNMAVANARKDMNSDVAALYIESLNNVIDIHALRVTVGLQTRIPPGVWVVLYTLIFFGMISIGYQMGISGSRRSVATLILTVAFTMVLSLIVMLDRPVGGIKVSQQPLINARAAMQ